MQSKLKAGNVRFNAAMVIERLSIGKQNFDNRSAPAGDKITEA